MEKTIGTPERKEGSPSSSPEGESGHIRANREPQEERSGRTGQGDNQAAGSPPSPRRVIKPLTLVTAALPEKVTALEEADKLPRMSLFDRTLQTDILNEKFLASSNPMRKWIYRLLPFSASQIIEAFFVRKKYDVVISWAERPGILFAALLTLTRAKVPHVALMTWISKPKKAFFIKLVNKRISTLVLWSTVQYDFAINKLRLRPERVKFVYPYADQKFYRPLERETDMICSAGREMRDFPTLIEAMRGLDIKCHIAVSLRGKMYDTVKAALTAKSVPSNVTVGNLPLDELRELYARSRFVVIPLLPTDTDNGLTVIIESMAMGKAVICSRVQGQVDLVIDGVTGIYVPQGDPVALREAIKYLWDNPEVAERMGREARRIVEEKYTIEQFVNSMKEIAEEAARSGRSR